MRNAFVIVPFALFLWVPTLAALLGFEAVDFENRDAAAPPEWTRSSWLDADAYSSAGRWLSDRLPLRGRAVALDSWLDFRLFGDSPTQEVLVGTDGELFLTDTLRWPCERNSAPRRIVQTLHRLARPLAARGTELIVLLSPNKSFLYSDRLPAVGTHLNRCASARRGELRGLLNDSKQIVAVDVFTTFESERRAGHRLFARLDRHWEDYAGVLQTRALVEAIAPGIWNEDAVNSGEPEWRSAELPIRFMNLDIPVSYATFEVERGDIEVEATQFEVAPSATQKASRVHQTSASIPLIPGRTLVVLDSFMLQRGNAFAAFPEDATYVHWNLLMSHPKATAALFLDADRVILQVVEDRAGIAFGKALDQVSDVLAKRLRAGKHGRRKPRTNLR